MSKDLFSGHASQYAAYRPTYPVELYDFLYQHVVEFENAWDAGTGNGQVAQVLARKFKNVLATDISKKQLENAVILDNIFYWQTGEQTSFASKSIDLITVAQAIHWFDLDKFYDEVKRVGKPGGAVAVWGYGLLSIDPTLNDWLRDFYVNVVGSYWEKDRKLIDERYQTISFPFREIKCPTFFIRVEWSLSELQGYLSTWSSVQKFIQINNYNPVDDLMKAIEPLWRTDKREIQFPVFMRLGKI